MERNQKGLSELNQTITSSFNASSEPEDLDVSVHQDSVAFCFTESDGTNIHSEDETHNDHHESRVYRHRKKSVSISLHEQSEHTPTISALDTQSIYLNLGRSISTASTGSNMMSSKECFKKIQEAYTALRAKIDYDSDKYCKQIVLLDYLNLCIQAQEFLKREHYSYLS